MSNMQVIQGGFRSIRLFRRTSPQREIRASRQRQAEALQRLRTLSPASMSSSQSRPLKP